MNIDQPTLLIEFIRDCESADAEKRNIANASLREIASQNPAVFVLACARELCQDNLSDLLRPRAALIIEDTLRESANGADELWKSFDKEIRQQIKNNVLGALAYPNNPIRESSAKLVSLFFGIEFSSNEWPELISNLSQNANHIDPEIKKSAILTLSRVCEELKRRKITTDKETTGLILSGIYNGIKNETNNSIKLISLQALEFSLNLNQELLNNKEIRSETLKLLLESISSNNRDIKICALKRLIEFIKVCGGKLESEVGDIWGSTSILIDENDQELAISAIKVWHTIFQEGELGPQVKKEIEDILGHTLYQNLLKSSNYEDTKLSIIATTKSCLTSFAQVQKDKFLQPSMEFIQAYITSQDPIELRASLIAYSCLLSSPSQQLLSEIVSLAIPTIMKILMENTSLAIQEEASTALLNTAEKMPKKYFEEQLFIQISEGLIAAINLHPKVSSRIAKLWFYLGEYLLSKTRAKEQIPYDLSIIIDSLVKNCFRDLEKESYGVIDHSLLATSSLLLCISKEEVRNQYLLSFVRQMRHTKDFEEKRREEFESGILLCIQNLLLQSEISAKNPIIDEIFRLLEEKFQTVGSVVSEGLGVLTSLISALGADFEPYFEKSWVWITQAFSKFDEPELFAHGLHATESLAHACPNALKSKLSEILTGLVALLDKPDFNRTSKLRIISAIGGIALGCRDLILPYAETLSRVYEVSMSAVVSNGAEGDSELADYIRNLRIRLLESYSSFFGCIAETSSPNLTLKSIPCVMEFLAVTCSQNYNPTPEYLRNALFLVSDVGFTLKDQVKQYIKSEMIVYLIESLSKFSNDPEDAITIDYAKTVLPYF